MTPWQAAGLEASSSPNYPPAALCWTSLPKVPTLPEICVAPEHKLMETLTESVQTSLFSITLASPKTFPISLSRAAKDSWACKGKMLFKKKQKKKEETGKAQQLAKPYLPESTTDTGNHCSGGNLFYARFAPGTNPFAKTDMSPHNQHGACQPVCI